MATITYDWLVYCLTHNEYITMESDTVPTVCPTGGAIDSTNVVIIHKKMLQNQTSDPVLIDSSATLCPAIEICASGTDGGIDLKAGINGIMLDSSSGGMIDISSPHISLGSMSGPCQIILGTDQTKVFERYGSGIIKYQSPEINLLDQDSVLEISQILAGLFTINPTSNRTLTIDSAANLVNGITGLAINDAVDFTIMNLGTNDIIINSIDGTILSGMNVNINPGFSGTFRIRFTNIISPGYTLYRL
jgi:hypothetical protein